MNKHKIVSRYGVTKYCIRSKSGQQLDEMAIQRLRSGEVPGLLVVEADRRKNAFQLVYDVTGLVSLSSFLQQTMTKNVFIKIIRNVVNIFTMVPEKHLELTKINFAIDSIFINPASNDLFYIYVPIGDCDNTVTLKNILMTITSHCSFSPTENNEYVTDFMRFLGERTNISKLELNTLLERMDGNMYQEQENDKRSCPHCGSMVTPDSVFCTSCGSRLANDSHRNPNVYDPFMDMNQQRNQREIIGGGMDNGLVWDSLAQDDFVQDSIQETAGRNGTTLLGSVQNVFEEDEGTSVLNERSAPYLVRSRTGERIILNHCPFRIGKDRNQCHYHVPDNNAVSRNHADIFYENGSCFIQDNGSTNGTYIDGRRVTRYQKSEIRNETQLRLANEDFVFFTEGREGL